MLKGGLWEEPGPAVLSKSRQNFSFRTKRYTTASTAISPVSASSFLDRCLSTFLIIDLHKIFSL